MVMKLNQTVEFCGKPRRFQRCPNKTLVEYRKSMDDIRERMLPLVEEERDAQFQLDEIVEEIDSINKHIELLEKLEDPSDGEIRECIDLTKKRIELQKEQHQLRVKYQEKTKSDRELYEKLDEELRESYSEFASIIFKDFDKSEFDEADDTDLIIAPQLGDLYRLATTGAKQKEVDKMFKDLVKKSFQ